MSEVERVLGEWQRGEVPVDVVLTLVAEQVAAARVDVAEQIAAWSSPSGWIAQQAVVAFLEDGDDPQPWELNGPRWGPA